MPAPTPPPPIVPARRHRYCRIPKAHGGGEPHHAPLPPRANRLLDGRLLAAFATLSDQQQRQAAAAAGATPQQLLADLAALEHAASFL